MTQTGNIDASDIVNEIPLPYSPTSSDHVNLRNASDSSQNNDYYEISTDSEDKDLPTYSINNLEMTVIEEVKQISF